MTTYEPGTVAMVTWDNAPLASQRRGVSDIQTERALRTEDGRWSLQSGWNHCITDDAPTDIRPLVVLDPDDKPVADFREWVSQRDGINWPDARRMADLIEAQTKPPRMAEPGLWGVVEAGTNGMPTTRRRFCRTSSCSWTLENSATQWEWAEFVDPKPVRDGIEDET